MKTDINLLILIKSNMRDVLEAVTDIVNIAHFCNKFNSYLPHF